MNKLIQLPKPKAMINETNVITGTIKDELEMQQLQYSHVSDVHASNTKTLIVDHLRTNKTFKF